MVPVAGAEVGVDEAEEEAVIEGNADMLNHRVSSFGRACSTCSWPLRMVFI